MKKKKMMTLEQLSKFCRENKLYNFSSKESGSRIYVQVPDVMEFADDKDDDYMKQGLMFCPVRICHVLDNANGSYISEKDMKKALPSLAYRPLLGAIHQLDDNSWDFHAHDMELIENEDGEYEYEYIESQIGNFTVDKPKLVYDEKYEKKFVEATVVIPEEYSKAADIIRAKGGTKVSCELAIDTMSYDAKNNWLVLEDFIFSGVTCLGSEADGTEIQEGMKGSRLSIDDFSYSAFSHIDKDQMLIDTLEKLNNTLSKFEKQEVNKKLKLNKLLEKYNKTVEELDFNYFSMTDEELEAKFAELFDGEETPDPVDPTPADPAEPEEEEEPMGNGDGEGADAGQGGGEDGDDEDEIPAPVLESQTTDTITVTAIEGQEYSIDNGENWQDSGEFTNLESNTEYSIITRIKAGEDTDPSEPSIALVVRTNVAADDVPDDDQAKKKQNNSVKPEKYSVTMNNGVIKEFALSLNDKISSLTTLVNEQYSEADDTYYSVIVYDKEVVMVDFWYGNAYRQSFKERAGVFSLTGDRVPVKPVYLTADEEAELDKIKSNYAAVTEELNGYHKAEETTKKEALMSSDEYKAIFETEDYKAIDIEEFSVDDLSKHLDEILLKQVKTGKFAYAENPVEEKKTSNKKLFGTGEKKSKNGRYGNLFAKQK